MDETRLDIDLAKRVAALEKQVQELQRINDPIQMIEDFSKAIRGMRLKELSRVQSDKP